MKMMRSTSVMSTSGVTLIPVIESSACDELPAIGRLLSVLPVGVLGLGTRSAAARAVLVPGCLGRAARARRHRLEVSQQKVAERLGVGDRATDDALERVEGGDGRDGDED